MLKIITHTYHAFMRTIFLQIILAFVTMPLLVGWGLPISIVGLLSNLFFAPALCAFLIIASIIFTTEVLHIPNSLIVVAFDYLSTYWLKALATSKSYWLIGFPAPSKLILGATTLIGIGFVICTKRLRIELRITCALLLLGSIMSSYHLLTPKQISCILHYKNYQITIQKNQRGLTLIIPALRTKTDTFLRWVNTQLKSTLYKWYGSTALHQIVLLNPSQQLINHIQQSSGISCNWITIIRSNNTMHYSTVTHQATPAPLFYTTQHAAD